MKKLIPTLICLFLVVPSQARTITVDDDGPADFNNIQAAINDSNNGDTVQVAAGTYYENVNVNKRIELIGVDMPVVNAGGRRVSTILVTADDCTVKGFQVTGSIGTGGWNEKNAGIRVESSNNIIENNLAFENEKGILLYYHSNNNTLRKNVCSNNSSDGIFFYYSGNNTLRENIMTNNPNNLSVWGGWGELSDARQDIDTSNTVDGKPIYYLVDKNNVVIDESTNAGCVVVVNSTNIVVRNLTLKHNGFGVLFLYTQDSNIENVTLLDNGGGGIWLQYSSNNIITGNNISNSYHGLCLWDSGNNTLRANTISNCTCNFGYWSASELSHFRQDIDISNTVDGKPIYYLVDESNRVIDSSSNAGYVGVVNSTNIVVKDLTLAKNEQGVLFAWTENSRIENITASNNADGIWLQYSSNDTLINSIVSNNFEDYSIYLQESNNTTIVNNTISGNNGYGIFSYFSSPTIVNNIIVANESYGIISYPSSPTISYNNVWDNYLGDYALCSAGPGDISADTLFVDAANGDYHLKSEGWRWDCDANQWTWDEVTSRCIDAGNPGSPLCNEPLTLVVDPLNRWGENLRIDMGAYGGTAEASMPPYDWTLLGDLTNDGLVNLKDYAFQVADWLNSADQQPGDLNRDSLIDISDLALLVEDWLKQTTWHE